MKVIVQLYSISFPGGNRHELELPEHSTVEAAIYALVDILNLKENKVEELLKYMLLVNGARANMDSVLSEGDKIMMFNKLVGG